MKSFGFYLKKEFFDWQEVSASYSEAVPNFLNKTELHFSLFLTPTFALSTSSCQGGTSTLSCIVFAKVGICESLLIEKMIRTLNSITRYTTWYTYLS